jgi:hypothetical protein
VSESRGLNPAAPRQQPLAVSGRPVATDPELAPNSGLSRRSPMLDPHEPSCDLGPVESAQLNVASFIIHYLHWEVTTGFWGRLSEMGLSVKLTAWRLRRETSQLSLWRLTESSPRPVGLKWWDVSARDERRCLPEVQPPRRHCADTNCLFRVPDSTVRHRSRRHLSAEMLLLQQIRA